ncbi:hypothetical protein TESG_08546 [Trichophyton tonsurans CBS 112818]|uniref:Uncharacterized protein n=1 Tax=Trichophyton tonsurans (strain CBS 112818) TaxID=647933 RepID=F2S4G2_TRIT1|nr:hypothetical protein TESG_08546 [Trichophyton tonsurans CBS 112818]
MNSTKSRNQMLRLGGSIIAGPIIVLWPIHTGDVRDMPSIWHVTRTLWQREASTCCCDGDGRKGLTSIEGPVYVVEKGRAPHYNNIAMFRTKAAAEAVIATSVDPQQPRKSHRGRQGVQRGG